MCNKGGLKNCGICCLLLSIWAIIQLAVMGVLYKIESTTLIGDVAAKDYTDYDDFIQKTKKQYQVTGSNCWLAAGIYFLTALLSVLCIISARTKKATGLSESDEDDIFCEPPEEPGGPRKKKKK